MRSPINIPTALSPLHRPGRGTVVTGGRPGRIVGETAQQAFPHLQAISLTIRGKGIKLIMPIKKSLKVVRNESPGGSGRWHTFGIGLGP
jgi:hypothetical protein